MTDLDRIELEVQINQAASDDPKLLADINDCVCNSMLEAGIPILYTWSRGPFPKKCFAGLLHGTIEAKDVTDGWGFVRSRLIVWRKDLFSKQ